MKFFAIQLLVLAICVNAGADALRRPIAMVNGGDHLIVAHRDSGTISVIDARSMEVVSETKIGRALSDLVSQEDGKTLFATDEADGKFIRLSLEGRNVRETARISVPAYPVSVRISTDNSFCTVASLWSRRLTICDVHDRSLIVRRVVDLPFAPREQLILPDGKSVIVADAFGGNLAIVEMASSKIVSLRSIEGHNIRGLAPSADSRELLISHQTLDDRTPTEPSRITWGQIVGNFLQAIPTSDLLAAGGSRPPSTSPEPVLHWSLYPLGKNGNGAGDPGAVVIAKSGMTVVALSGVNEVAIRRSALDAFNRVPVGRRPNSLAFSDDQTRLFVANMLDDSVSVIDLASQRVIQTISLGSQPELTEQQRGEQLFYDAKLSLEGWYSCQSCHTDGHTNGGRNDNFSDGSFGTPKQIPSLLGVESTRPWGWNGRMNTHEVQVQQSILGTMHGSSRGASAANVNAIAGYIRSLTPPPGISAARGEPESAAAKRGQRMFEESRCLRCHSYPDYTSDRTYDVGLADEAGSSSFNPPSLLGVSQRSAFLHDGRAKSLQEVFTKFNHPDGKPPTRDQVDDLIAYLNRL